MTAPKPDVEAIMSEVRAAATQLKKRLPSRRAATVLSPHLLTQLGDGWDAWNPAPVESHRGLIGLPIVLAKRSLMWLLSPYSREIFKRQRLFNEATRQALEQLDRRLAQLAAAQEQPEDT